jgi:hypothetical protein
MPKDPTPATATKKPKPMLQSSDYDGSPNSFTLQTGDSYFKRETVVYVKGTPAAHADALNVIVWFHGFYVEKGATIFHDVTGQEVKLLENLKNCPLQELVFMAPWMGYVLPQMEFVLDEHKEKIPVTDRRGHVIPGKFKQRHVGSGQYREVEIKLGKSADEYIERVLEGLANFLETKGQTLKSNDNKPLSQFAVRNLIVACHSGGGVAMRRFVEGLGGTNKPALRQCWCFDCLYGDDDADFWFKRDRGAPPFYVYYYDTAGNATQLLKLMGHGDVKEFSQEGASLNVIDNSGKSHYRTASEGFAERLKNVKLP